ncbi:type II toxin-antitoxin system Phd/YefM family antitoxin [Candidatus Roizmanbacteria bacterium]|nr:type II toxin-antitoxin system Phd/YefM family antitoxin [Candidatus Roizmanbacteria bacterium]
MDVKTTIPISTARKNIFTIADDVERSGARYILTENGRPKAVIISAEEFASWIETFEIAEQFPHLLQDIKQARRSYDKGRYTRLEEVLAQYEVPARTRTKSKKRSR